MVKRPATWYYTRTVEGDSNTRSTAASAPSPCRRRPARSTRADSPEEMLLDQNEMAKGLAFLSIGEFEVSDDDQQLLYSTDATGFRQYSLFVKDLRTGAVRGPLAERVTSAAWAADNRTLFYVTEDAAKRPAQAVAASRRQPDKDALVYEEKDELFRIGVADRATEVRRPRLEPRHGPRRDARPARPTSRPASSGSCCPARRATSTTSTTATAQFYIRTNKDAAATSGW